jgi:hypothetical protein
MVQAIDITKKFQIGVLIYHSDELKPDAIGSRVRHAIGHSFVPPGVLGAPIKRVVFSAPVEGSQVATNFGGCSAGRRIRPAVGAREAGLLSGRAVHSAFGERVPSTLTGPSALTTK